LFAQPTIARLCVLLNPDGAHDARAAAVLRLKMRIAAMSNHEAADLVAQLRAKNAGTSGLTGMKARYS